LTNSPRQVPAGTRVEIRIRFLEPDERAPGLPSDTARLPYEGRTRGYLLAAASEGDVVRIATPTGREMTGVLETVEPSDTHTFGRPCAALVAAVRAIQATGALAVTGGVQQR